MRLKTPKPPKGLGLAEYLASLRASVELTLREVEEATDKEVSNAYLSQLETGKIRKPSPNVLHSLARVYGVAYETLMEKAGYLAPAREKSSSKKHGQVATNAPFGNLTEEEERATLAFLAAYRKSKRR